MSDTDKTSVALRTSGDTEPFEEVADIAETNLRSHIIQSFAQAHGAVKGNDGIMYDSNGDSMGDVILTVVIGGSTYYIPARYVGVSAT